MRRRLRGSSGDLEYNAAYPSIVISHVPLATSIGTYCPRSNSSVYDPVSNGSAIIPLLEKSNVIALLQGHIPYRRERAAPRHPVPDGRSRLRKLVAGDALRRPEGVTFVTVDGVNVSTRYVPTGFQTIDPDNTQRSAISG